MEWWSSGAYSTFKVAPSSTRRPWKTLKALWRICVPVDEAVVYQGGLQWSDEACRSSKGSPAFVRCESIESMFCGVGVVVVEGLLGGCARCFYVLRAIC